MSRTTGCSNTLLHSTRLLRVVLDKFKETFVDTGILDVNLLIIYKKMIVKADQLLQIFKDEKWKMGHFTCETIPQANKYPADESLEHARTFFNNIKKVIKTKNKNQTRW